MKKVISIQSVSDIITNSSSEVFIIDAKDAEKAGEKVLDFELITLEHLKQLNYPIDDIGFVCELAGIEYNDDIEGIQDLLWSDYDTGLEYWSIYVDEHMDQFNTIIGKALIEVGDENGWDYVEERVTNLVKHGAKHVDGRDYSKCLGF